MPLKLTTAGESHGPRLTAILEGIPAGLRIDPVFVNRELSRRQHGHGRGGRMKIEKDEALFEGGVRGGRTLGSPIAIGIENRDHANWRAVMGALAVESDAARDKRLVRPRPGHADLAGGMKYGATDLRDVLERASARESAARVAAGAICKLLLRECGIEVKSGVLSVGSAVDEASRGPDTLAHDEIEPGPDGTLRRRTNRAGGLEGGVTNGEDVIAVAFMKPLSTLAKGLDSVDLETGEPARSAYERSDVAAVP